MPELRNWQARQTLPHAILDFSTAANRKCRNRIRFRKLRDLPKKMIGNMVFQFL